MQIGRKKDMMLQLVLNPQGIWLIPVETFTLICHHCIIPALEHQVKEIKIHSIEWRRVQLIMDFGYPQIHKLKIWAYAKASNLKLSRTVIFIVILRIWSPGCCQMCKLCHITFDQTAGIHQRINTHFCMWFWTLSRLECRSRWSQVPPSEVRIEVAKIGEVH